MPPAALRRTIWNALRFALRIVSGKIILYFGTPERLRTLRCAIFTNGVVKANSSGSTCFLRLEPSRSSLRDATSPERGRFCSTYRKMPKSSPKGMPFGAAAKCAGAPVSPSQALPRQLPQRGSQAIKFITKVLGTKRKLPAVLLALPLGELSPQVTERARLLPETQQLLSRTLIRRCAPPSPDWGKASASAGKFPACVQSVRFRQRLPL